MSKIWKETESSDSSRADVLTVSWYDDYAFLGNMDGIPSAASQTSPTRFDVMAITDCGDEQYEYGGVGRMTGRMEKVLGETDGNQYLWSVLYYDDRGRVVQESHATHRGGWQRTNTGYDFTGHPLKARIIHSDPTVGDMTERYTYSYDAWGRPLTVTHRLDALSPVVLHDYVYDAVGRLESDSMNGDADLNTNYEYNVRSWLTDIKVGGNAQQGTLGETFTEKLYYQALRPVNPQQGVQWSGNVSAMDWMAGSDGVSRRYDFAYDGLSRLTGAGYADDGAGQNDYSRGYGYDRNGNVTLLATATDTTQVSYTGNHLTDGSNYAYDANGNLTKDLGRGIAQISYNLLNLPSNVAPGLVGGPHGVIYGVDSRDYLYTASGVKLQSKAQFPLLLPGMPDVRERTDYVGNLIYDRTSLQKVLFDGGYVDMSGDSPEYCFFVMDHLGGNRLVADAAGTILQTNHYDPYGESLPAGSAVDSGNPYKYSGKEYDDKALAYDFGARHYTSSIPRWTTMDPLAEKYYSISPYAYCAGNPMNFVDEKGMALTDFYNLKGKLIHHVDDGKDDQFIVINPRADINSLQQKDVLPVPSSEILDQMDQAYKETEETGVEHGFQVDLKGNPGPMGEGSENTIDLPLVFEVTGEYVAYDIHTHPKPESVPNQLLYNDVPSDKDKAAYVGSFPNIVLGYYQVEGTVEPVKSVAFYVKTGIVHKSVDYNSFKKTVNRINKSKR